MGRKAGKKYRREIRKEQSKRDKDALFWKLGKQLSDPLGEYREFIGNLRNKEINEVDDYVDIPINLVDLTANLITSLITGENCLYESIKESDKRLDHSHKKIKEKDKASDIEEEPLLEKTKEESNETTNEKTKRTNVQFNEVINIIEDNGIKFKKFQPTSNSSSSKKNKIFSLNFREYCQHENEESFHFIRKIIKKTQLSLTTFIVGLYFIYSYKHLEKDKRKQREKKVSRYISDWPSPTSKKSSRKKKRKRKNKNKNNNPLNNGSDEINSNKESSTSQNSNEELSKNENYKNHSKSYSSSDDNPTISTSSSDIVNSDLQNTEAESSPILKAEFLSTFQPKNTPSSTLNDNSSIESKASSVNSNIETIMAQYPSPSRSPSHTSHNGNNKNAFNKRKKEQKSNGEKSEDEEKGQNIKRMKKK